jgi:hypothetical protein
MVGPDKRATFRVGTRVPVGEHLRHLDSRPKGPIEDHGESRNLLGQRFSGGRHCFGEPSSDDLVVGQRPRAGHDATDDHDIRLTADQRPPGRRHDVGVGCARTEHPLVVSRQESHGSRRGRRGQFLEILAQDVGGLPVDVDRREAVAEAREDWIRLRRTPKPSPSQ